MFWNILKRDLKRKKTMNIILLVFVILASMFTAAGANNVIAVAGGTDSFLKMSNIGDYVAVTIGEDGVGALDDKLNDTKEITAYRGEKVGFGSKNDLKYKGEDLETRNTTVYQSIDETKITLFDQKNEKLTQVEEGTVRITGLFMEKNNMKDGDELSIEIDDVKLTLKAYGGVKDALFGSDFMGNTRFIMNQKDYDKLLECETFKKYYLGEVYYIDCTDAKAVNAALSGTSGLNFTMETGKLSLIYVMEMIVAIIVLIVSICLIIVAFLVLRFTINFTITEEYREIGVMKAIGIKNSKIRSLYMVKYLMLSIVGAAIGFVLSIPFGKALLQTATKTMVLSNNLGIAVNIIGSLLVVLITILFAYLCTGKVKKASPVDAIRNGQTGERFKKKKGYRLSKSHGSSCLYLAANDVLSSPRRFLSILITFCLCSLMIFIIVNTTSTMTSDSMVGLLASKSDLYFNDTEGVMSFMTKDGKETLDKYIKEKEDILKDAGMPGKIAIELQYKYKISNKGEDYTIACSQGYGVKAGDYEYTEGEIPQNKNEVAITKQVSKMIDAKIGDEIEIEFQDGKEKCMITGYFQSMNNLGEIIRLHQDAKTDFAHLSSGNALQINFDDHPDAKTIAERKEVLKDKIKGDRILDCGEFCADCIGVVDTMKTVELLLLVITIFVIILVTVLMERSFISNEKSQIAILKAMGFRDSQVIKWHIIRFGLVCAFAVALAVALSIPASNLVITPVFQMMGAESIRFVYDPTKICLVYPAIILGTTLIMAYLVSLYSKTISSRDTASIE